MWAEERSSPGDRSVHADVDEVRAVLLPDDVVTERTIRRSAGDTEDAGAGSARRTPSTVLCPDRSGVSAR